MRAATLADVVAIATVQVEGWRAAYEGILPSDMLAELSVEERAAMWRRLLEAPGPRTSLWVALDKGVVGFASVGPSRDDDARDEGEVYAIYAAPTRWSSGVGRALVVRALDALRDADFAVATLWVLEENERARRFYERTGFALDGGTTTEDVGGREVTELRYRMVL